MVCSHRQPPEDCPQLTYTLQQVLYKRKPVQFLPPAEVEDEDTEVWQT